MPVFQLPNELIFPPAELANEDGILAVGGDLSTQRLLLAYSNGIFPWPHESYPLLWFSPDPRFVLEPQNIHVSKSLKKRMRNCPYEIMADHSFVSVMSHCSQTPRPGQDGTWITNEMVASYAQLHDLGYAHSVEAYDNQKLVGGVYGISLGGVFFGESMFAIAPDASKICFATLAANLIHWDFDLIDCQAQTDHLKRFGATDWPRKEFLATLSQSIKKKPTRMGRWLLELNPVEALQLLA